MSFLYSRWTLRSPCGHSSPDAGALIKINHGIHNIIAMKYRKKMENRNKKRQNNTDKGKKISEERKREGI